MRVRSPRNSSAHIGRLLEQKVSKYLAQEGYKIVDNNYRGPRGEIDIIAAKGDSLIFVEVKGRQDGELYGWGLSRLKQRRIIETSKDFLYKRGVGDGFFIRYDVVAVDLETLELSHWENAFTETGVE